MRTKDNGKYNTAGNTGKKKCAAFNWLKGVTAVLCAVVMYFAVTIGVRGYDMYKDAIAQVSLKDKVSEIRSKESYTVFSDLPETYTDAVLSVEDHRFYGHIGIDPIAITRAMVNDVKAGRFVEGGSTITQQLAKNLYFTQEKKMERKVAEVFMAFALERDYSKNEILELYVNTIYFGNGYYCIKDASKGYFGKEPEDLTDYESTLLAGVPNAPSKYSPTVNLELAEKRQEQVVERLVACGLFTKERALETLAGSEM